LLTRLTGGPSGPRVRAFAKNLGYLLGTDLLLTALTFGLTAWVVRTLGPAEFGQVNLTVSVAQFWLVAMLLGMHAGATRFIAAHPGDSGRIAATALALAAGACLVLAPLILAGRGQGEGLFGVGPGVFTWSVVLAASLVAQQVGNGILAGFQRFRDISAYNAAAGLAFAAIAGALLMGGRLLTFADFIAANVARWLIFGACALVAVHSRLGRPSWPWARQLLGFGGYYTVSAAAHLLILGAIDTLILNAYHGPGAVGLYGAYYVSFNLFSNRVLRLVSDVMMPAAAAHEDRRRLLRRALGLYARSAWFLVPAVVVLTAVLFRVYGGAFAFRWELAALMGVNVSLYAISTLLGDFLVAAGNRGMRLSMYAAFVTAAINVCANLLLVPPLAVTGTLLASSLAFSVSVGLRGLACSRLE
jgi:O-antigen/teichoic acid export membrane protein